MGTSSQDQEYVRLEILFDKEVVDWIDALKDRLGLSRSFLVNQLLREVMAPDSE